MTHEEVKDQLMDAEKVIIVPGYGMAVAQAQHIVQEMTDNLRKRGKKVFLPSTRLPEDFPAI